MAELLQDTIEVEHNSQTYEFRIPGYVDEIKIGIREKNIRRQIEQELGGDASGWADGLDQNTYLLIRFAAVFELLLQKSSDDWPWSKGEHGEPVIDFKKWPKNKTGEAIAIGLSYQDSLLRFHQGGLANGYPVGEEVVAGQPDTQSVPVRSRLDQT